MGKHTPGPWEYVPSTEHHGPYVVCEYGPTVCDLYVMSQPSMPSTANGGPSKPIHHLHEMADPNARLIAAAPDLFRQLREARAMLGSVSVNEDGDDDDFAQTWARQLSAIDAALAKATTPET